MRTFGLPVLALAATLVPLTVAFGSERPTAVHHYIAFQAGKLGPGLKVRTRVSGYCWTGSATAYPRSDAWRCFEGRNEIVDPCFSAPKTRSGFVVCPDQAWNGGVVLLRLTKPLPLEQANPGGRGRVWAIVTASGLHCNRLEGALPVIDGKPLRFACGRTGSLAGEPNTSKPLWTTYYAPSQRSSHLSLVAISDAWW